MVSACLMGFQVRYNGSHKARLANVLSRWQSEGRLVTHCPERLPDCPSPGYRRKSLARRERMSCKTVENC